MIRSRRRQAALAAVGNHSFTVGSKGSSTFQPTAFRALTGSPSRAIMSDGRKRAESMSTSIPFRVACSRNESRIRWMIHSHPEEDLAPWLPTNPVTPVIRRRIYSILLKATRAHPKLRTATLSSAPASCDVSGVEAARCCLRARRSPEKTAAHRERWRWNRSLRSVPKHDRLNHSGPAASHEVAILLREDPVCIKRFMAIQLGRTPSYQL